MGVLPVPGGDGPNHPFKPEWGAAVMRAIATEYHGVSATHLLHEAAVEVVQQSV